MKRYAWNPPQVSQYYASSLLLHTHTHSHCNNNSYCKLMLRVDVIAYSYSYWYVRADHCYCIYSHTPILLVIAIAYTAVLHCYCIYSYSQSLLLLHIRPCCIVIAYGSSLLLHLRRCCMVPGIELTSVWSSLLTHCLQKTTSHFVHDFHFHLIPINKTKVFELWVDFVIVVVGNVVIFTTLCSEIA